MPNKKNATKYILIFFLLIGFLFTVNFIIAQEVQGVQNLDELNKSIENKKTDIEKIKEKIEIYEKNIQLAQEKSVTLKNQLSILGDQIYKNNLKIKATKEQLEETNLEIEKTNRQISATVEQINKNHARLSEFIRIIDKDGQQDFLEILAVNDSFSSFFNQLNYLDDIQVQVRQTLVDSKEKKGELDQHILTLRNKKDELDALQNKLLQQEEMLAESNLAKSDLLVQTKFSEKNFQNTIFQLKTEQDRVNSEIMDLEAAIRRRLQEMNKKEDGFDINQDAQLSWPVNPTRGISAYFHDPDYPFRHIFEHPAIDIRAYQGTNIKAAESGYVAKAKNNGYGYSYIMIIHGNGLSTVYGHTSRIDVEQDSYIAKGQIIGAVGGTPGTKGAGSMTTGPHLHFEVRKDGIPINPLEYLP
ncbi:MAG: peptidoglycan DD-metalloendopeptidase family protein [bacterium]